MIAAPSSRRLRIFGAIAVVTFIVTFLHLRPQWQQFEYGDYYDRVANYFSRPVYDNTLYNQGNEQLVHKHYNTSDPCARFPSTDGVLLVMKTGATEAFDRIPTQLLTTMSCLPDNFLIFSDMEQQMGPYHIYDALSAVDEADRARIGDFDLYRTQQECIVSQQSCIDAKAQRQSAWNLDKYKFMPMIEETWRMRPGQDWYIFAEADTYVFWANMMHWLKKKSGLNPRDKIYLGSRSFVNNRPFAHGGSGYILSGGVLRHLVEKHDNLTRQYTDQGTRECCGDLLVALALDEHEGIKIRQTWPMINGEKPTTIPYGRNHWCEPILTMHHMNAEEISTVWQFEQTRKTDRVLLIKDLYDSLIAPKMQDIREHWDNGSDDVCYINRDPEAQERAGGRAKDRQKKEDEMTDIEKEAWKSPENCAKVCETEISDGDSGNKEKQMERNCFQYRWHDEVCCTAKSFKLGEPKSKPSDENDQKAKWTSGWYMKGIHDWIEAVGECKKPAWKIPEL
ncbi:glycosyltransferase family 31 protein [Astrocystis sublimbata]|nr:glycosyltransferase family 31 protein [Astrocystis sublimbata]